MLDRAAPLPDDPARLKGMAASLAAELQTREEALRPRAQAGEDAAARAAAPSARLFAPIPAG